MKKNLMFLTLLISVLMLSVVSAGITGYLVRGSGIRDAGYTATLQKVEGTTAIVSVQTPSGTTEVVRIKEGETTKVGDTEISASSLTKGTLFRRAGAELSLNISAINMSSISAIAGKFPAVGSGASASWNGMSCSVYGGNILNNTNLTGYDFCTSKNYNSFCLIERQGITDVYTNLNTGKKGPFINGCNGKEWLLYEGNYYAPLTCDNIPRDYNWGCNNGDNSLFQDDIICC